MAKRRYTQNFASGVEEEDKLLIHYCLHCGSYALILDVPLAEIPHRRRTDNSIVLEERKILKKNMMHGEVKVVRRPNGLERQYRLNCTECGLFVAYRPVDFEEDSRFMYVLPDALGTRQELTLGLKHHTLAELRGQLATLLARHPTGILLSSVRSLFKQNFKHDLDERDYGEYKTMESLIRALPDVATLNKAPPESPTDLLVLPVSAPVKKPRTETTTTPSTTASSTSKTNITNGTK